MYICLIGLFLAAFQATCDGAPERLVPALKLPADVLQEEKLVEKRTMCKDQQDKNDYCPYWQRLGYCKKASKYHGFMQANCYVSCNCEVSPTPVPEVDEDACLKAHNDKRALHQNTEPLTWNDTLAQYAKEWADKLRNGASGHDPKERGGENIYWSWSSTVRSCADAVEAWYGEIKDYDYAHPGYNSSTGHFTQVVWKETEQVGAALAKKVGSDGYTETYVVARYSPPGNYPGEFANNVMPQKREPAA